MGEGREKLNIKEVELTVGIRLSPPLSKRKCIYKKLRVQTGERESVCSFHETEFLTLYQTAPEYRK